MGKLARKLTYDEVKHYIEVESNSGCKLLSEKYMGNKVPLHIQCACGNKFEVHFNSFKTNNKRQCNDCGHKLIANHRQKTQIQFETEVKHMTNGEYEVLGKYINSDTPIDILHKTCGEVNPMIPNNILRGATCRPCSYIKRNREKRHSFSDIKKYIESQDYKLLDKSYVNCDEDLTLKCPIEHRPFKMSFDRFKNAGQRCPTCARIRTIEGKTIKKEQVYRLLTDLKFVFKQFVSEYKNSESYFIAECYDGHLFKTNYKKLSISRKCPTCSMSKGEQSINKVLKDNMINFNYNPRSIDCINKRGNVLPFDFSLNTVLIEYDGEYHFEKVNYTYNQSDEKFERTKEHDKIKNQYCIDNNIPLIRIPYWEFNNIEYILENLLKHYNLIESDNTYNEEIVMKYLVDENWDHDTYLKWNDKESRDIPMKELILVN